MRVFPASGLIVSLFCRSFFFIAPEMRCLDVVWVVICPRPSHSFGIPVVRYHIVIVGELFVANRAFPILLDNLAVQELSHLSRGPEFPISSRVVRILNLRAGRFCSPDHRGGRLGAAKRVIMVGARQPHAGTLHQPN
jgi:hypothetical protein